MAYVEENVNGCGFYFDGLGNGISDDEEIVNEIGSETGSEGIENGNET